MHRQQEQLVKAYGKQPSTATEVAEAMVATLLTKHGLLGFAWNVKYSSKVSNSHDCPLDGVSNWCSQYHDKPTSYPGYEGRVWVRFDGNHPERHFSAHDALDEVMGYPGTGGGGGYDGPWEALNAAVFKMYGHNRKEYDNPYPRPDIYSWDFRFFLMDFPELEKAVTEEITWRAIKGNTKFQDASVFEWQDPVVAAADEEFMAASRYEFKRRTERRILKPVNSALLQK